MKRRSLWILVAILGVPIIALLAWWLLGEKSYPVAEYPTRIVGEWLRYPKINDDFLIVWVYKADGTGEIRFYTRLGSLKGRRFCTEDDKRDNFLFRPWNTRGHYQPYMHIGNWIQTIDDNLRIAQAVNRPNVGVMFHLHH